MVLANGLHRARLRSPGAFLIGHAQTHLVAHFEGVVTGTLLQAELLDLKASPHLPGRGVVIEAKLDRGKGPMATLLVTEGTLRVGDALLAGRTSGRVRALYDDRGRACASAGPATPVAVIGLADVPDAGDPVDVVAHLARAQEIAAQRAHEHRARSLVPMARRPLASLAQALGTARQPELGVVLKADVRGSVDALAAALQKLSTDRVRLSIVHSAPGGVTESDVALAAASGAIVVGFNVKPVGNAQALAEQSGVDIHLFQLIYELLDQVKQTMLGRLEPERVESRLGSAEVRRLFRVPKVGVVAGCVIAEGLIRRSASARVVRGGKVLWEGGIATLRHLKDDVSEVKQGLE